MVLGDNFLFVQIPRTSSSSMTLYISALQKVTHLSEHGSFLDTGLDSLDTFGKTVFSFVRNPFEREFSEWKYHTNKDFIAKPISFTEWVYWRYADVPLNSDHFVPQRPEVFEYLRTFARHPQLGWMLDSNLNLKTDFIGFFETRYESTKGILFKLGITKHGEFPTHEMSRKDILTSSYRTFYTPETRKLIEDRYKPDLEAFGYTFEKREGNNKINLSAVSDFSFVEKVYSYLHK